MKRFKIGFAAVIAILAISVTVASYAGAFKATKAAPAAIDCFTTVKYLPNPPSCTAITLIQGQDNCPAVDLTNLPAFATNAIDPAACGPNGSLFCCAKVIALSPSKACPDQTYVTKISEVRCKE